MDYIVGELIAFLVALTIHLTIYSSYKKKGRSLKGFDYKMIIYVYWPFFSIPVLLQDFSWWYRLLTIVASGLIALFWYSLLKKSVMRPRKDLGLPDYEKPPNNQS